MNEATRFSDECAHCHRVFTPTEGNQVYCSVECATDAADTCPGDCGIPLSQHPPGPPCPPRNNLKQFA